jgi:cold shock CspA family protein
MYPPADRAAVEESGTVKWYNTVKGFGFIASDRGGKDIFVHASALDRAGIGSLTEGQRVAVDVIEGRKGPEAAGLRLILKRQNSLPESTGARSRNASPKSCPGVVLGSAGARHPPS